MKEKFDILFLTWVHPKFEIIVASLNQQRLVSTTSAHTGQRTLTQSSAWQIQYMHARQGTIERAILSWPSLTYVKGKIMLVWSSMNKWIFALSYVPLLALFSGRTRSEVGCQSTDNIDPEERVLRRRWTQDPDFACKNGSRECAACGQGLASRIGWELVVIQFEEWEDEMVSYRINRDSDAGRSGGEVFAISSVRKVETAHFRASGRDWWLRWQCWLFASYNIWIDYDNRCNDVCCPRTVQRCKAQWWTRMAPIRALFAPDSGSSIPPVCHPH